MEKWPGVGDRIVKRLREIKGGLYWNTKRDRPDVLQTTLRILSGPIGLLPQSFRMNCLPDTVDPRGPKR